MGPMLLNNSINALAPCAMDPPEGAASLSACSAKNRNPAVKIGIHLTLNGNRRVTAIQAADVPCKLSNWMRATRKSDVFQRLGWKARGFRVVVHPGDGVATFWAWPCYAALGIPQFLLRKQWVADREECSSSSEPRTMPSSITPSPSLAPGSTC